MLHLETYLIETVEPLTEPVPPAAADTVTILVVSGEDGDFRFLRSSFSHKDWRILRAATIDSAARLLKEHTVAVVVCDTDLPDGTWRELLFASESNRQSPMLVVASRRADERLWAEVLNLGGYDVLAKPWDRGELTQVVSMA